MIYVLDLTENDVGLISFIGVQHNWGRALKFLEVGSNFLTEKEAQSIAKAFEEDRKKEHRPLPLLSRESELYYKLMEFWKSIV